MLSETTEKTIITENTPDGWSRHPVWEFQKRNEIKSIIRHGADAYAFSDMEKKILVSIVYADLTIAGFHSISVMDYSKGIAVSERSMKRVSSKVSKLPDSSSTDSSLTYYDSQMMISLMKRSDKRRLLVTAPYLELPSGEKGFKADITLMENPGNDSLSTITRLNDGKCISYMTRYTPLSAEGTLFIGDRIERLSQQSVAGVTWTRSRGISYYSDMDVTAFGSDGINQWGLSLSGNNELKNAIFFNGRLTKLGKCHFSNPEDLISSAWHIEDEDGRISIDMKPLSVLRYKEAIRPLRGESIEVFGLFSGCFTLDHGTRFDIKEAYGSIKKAAARS